MTQADCCRIIEIMEPDFFKPVIPRILDTYPQTQAIYLFGSAQDSISLAKDVDLALLLPPLEAKEAGPLSLTDLVIKLENLLQKPVDLINLRLVSVVFRKEIIFNGLRIYTGNRFEAETFEMLTLSFYQRLNEERKEILKQFYLTGRAYTL